MYYAHKAIVYRSRVHGLELRNCLEYKVISEQRVHGKVAAGQHLSLGAAGHLRRIHNICSGCYDIAGDSVKRPASLRSKQFGCLLYLRVNMCKFEDV